MKSVPRAVATGLIEQVTVSRTTSLPLWVLTCLVSTMSYKAIWLSLCVMLLSGKGFAQWQMQKVNTDASFRGLSVVSAKVVWASGTKGTFVKTTDGGRTWQTGQVKGAETLDFRDVEAFSAKTAYLLSIGNGAASRIYRTDDGGQNWQLQFQNTDPDAFFDALAFWDKNHGLAMSDPVRGRFLVLRTDDGGKHWTPIDSDKMPAAKTGEGGFAASGTCLVTHGKQRAWLVSGGGAARVYQSNDKGQTWQVMDSPIISGPAGAGIFSLAWADTQRGVIVGGDYQKPTNTERLAAFTVDGGATWQLSEKMPAGYRSGAAWSRDGKRIVAVGPTGSDESRDGGKSWQKLDEENFNAVAFASDGTLWAVGPNGRLALLRLSK